MITEALRTDEELKLIAQLTSFEKCEIRTNRKVYTIGNSRVKNLKRLTDRNGFYKTVEGE